MSEDFKASIPNVAWKEVAGMRVLLAHAYHRVDFEVVWIAATVSVPDLVIQIKNLEI